MNRLILICFSLVLLPAAIAEDRCMTIHGRAHLYGGDGQLRIWRIGTHHDFEPDESTWGRVINWLNAGVTESDRKNYASPASEYYLFGDFVVCPVEPFKKGSVQRATVKSVTHRRYVRVR